MFASYVGVGCFCIPSDKVLCFTSTEQKKDFSMVLCYVAISCY